MPLTSTNFIAGKMNKSVDERLIPPGQYIDALNVRLGSTETTEIGAVENSKGNSVLTEVKYNNDILSGAAKTIGAYEDGVNETLYWFINDENNVNSPTGKVDLIVSYNTTTSALIYHCISTQVLNFDKKYLITGVSKIDNLLFFTDHLNPPRVINVTRDYEYASNTGGFDVDFEEEDINVIKKPPGFETFDPATQEQPLSSPWLEYGAQAQNQENYMETRFLSFAYRYRYDDGEYSATSLFSNPAFQPKPYQFSVQNFNNSGMENRYNQVNVWFSTGSRRVVEVDLLYKQSTSNTIYVIKRFNKADLAWADEDFRFHTFNNSEIYTTLGSDELLRLYDNVPRIAKAQTIKGNRLIYGNYTDGYDMSLTPGGVLIQMDYIVEPYSVDISGDPLGNGGVATTAPPAPANPVSSTGTYTAGPTGSVADSVLTWDLSEAVPSGNPQIIQGTTFGFDFAITQHSNQCTGGASQCTDADAYTNALIGTTFNISMVFTCPVNYVDIDDMLESQAFKDRVGGSIAQGFTGLAVTKELYPCNNADSGGTLTDKFYGHEQTSITGTNLELVNGSVTTACAITTFPIICSTLPVTSGTTNGNVAGSLTDTTTDFSATTPAVAVGDLVMNLSTGLVAEVNDITNAALGELGLINVDPGAVLELEQGSTASPCPDCVSYQITQPGGSPPCAPDGFVYQGPTTLGVTNSFSIQIPATQYYYDDNAGNTFTNWIYYNFISFGCTAQYLKSANQLSLHSNRDYEVGVVYMDGYGRASTVMTSIAPTCYFPPDTSVLKNSLRVILDNPPPYWAEKYKFVVKPNQGTYNTIYTNVFYAQDGTAEVDDAGGGNILAQMADPSLIWFKLDGSNQNIVKEGDEITVKIDSVGPVLTEEKSIVLAIQGFSSKAITNVSLKGLYMLLKPDGWTTEQPEDATYFRGKKTRKSTSSSYNSVCYNDYNLNDDNDVPYTIPAGSTIRIKVNNWRGHCTGSCDGKNARFDKTFVATDGYPTFHDWAIGDDLQSRITDAQCDCHEMHLSFDPTLVTGGGCTGSAFHTKLKVRKKPDSSQWFVNDAGLKWCSCYAFDGRPSNSNLTIEVTRGGGVFVFESETMEVDENLFYDASEFLDIEPNAADPTRRDHIAKKAFDPGTKTWALAANETSQNQVSGAPLLTYLNFGNCYTFANGVESFRILDNPAGKPMAMGERILAVSNQDFKEADRFAGLTYSGVFSGPANSNNLNEFNLGLVNYKDCETSFGPIMKLHARETDLLTLQEDRISYVTVNKNVVTDSTGGGAILSVPQVLGTQVARIEEFGISFNPESFVAWGYDMFFTDTKRGAVINLRGATAGSDQLSVISTFGMHSWFRDQFNAQLTTQKLGGYDPYMQEYVLGTNNQAVPVPIPKIPCGQTVVQMSSPASLVYEVDLGLVIGTITIPYIVTLGTITIDIVWNNTTYTSGPVNSNGSFTFDKTLNSPEECEVTITAAAGSKYEITVGCPPKIEITVIQVVVNSPNYDGETIHTDYQWDNGFVTSPWAGISPSALTSIQPAEWESNSGTRSIGPYPYDGVDLTMRTRKIAPDVFDLDLNGHRFKILSSNTLYPNTLPGVNALLAAGTTTIAPPFTSIPSTPGWYKATINNISLPIGNEFLYLIWDLRLITEAEVCTCDPTDTAQDVCCTCSTGCTKCNWSPVANQQSAVCAFTVESPGNWSAGFTTSSTTPSGIPDIGSYCFVSTSCELSSGYVPTGFYIVCPTSTQTYPKVWVEIDSNGVCVNKGIC